MQSRIMNYFGYTIITSISHGLMAPLKIRLQPFIEKTGSENVFMGMGEVIGGFPPPEKTILVPGCMREAVFDKELPEEDREYRKIFGDRIMAEVQSFISKIPDGQASFRKAETDDAVEDIITRIMQISSAIGISVGENEKDRLKKIIIQ